MSRRKTIIVTLFVLICSVSIAYAVPSGGVYPPEFRYENGYWYDSWDFNRNYYAGEDGFLPYGVRRCVGVRSGRVACRPLRFPYAPTSYLGDTSVNGPIYKGVHFDFSRKF